jgi:murein DD-endopeptidase MepM/ murein hydrolase activator NlpD
MLALVLAGGGVLLAPAPGPRGEVLDLVGQAEPGGFVTGQEPSPGEGATEGSSAQPSPSAAPTANSSPAPGSSSTTGSAGNPPASGTSWSREGGPMRQQLWAAEHLAPPISSLEGYVWPLAHPRLTLPFGPTVWGSRLVDGEPFHDGVDLATFCGDRIHAAHSGTVLAAGRHFDRLLGWVGDLEPYFRRLDRKGLWMSLPIVVVIEDGNGYRSVYAHFERVVVKPGQQVEAGQLIGFEGATGHASGCHLHYSLFSPRETATFGMEPDVAKRNRLPMAEIARIDPLLVLPPKKGINAPAGASDGPVAPTSP